MLNSRPYEYNFEIETILQQFIAIIDNAIVMRYSVNKESGNRELDEVIKPGYILGTKQRVMWDIINKSKNYELPLVIISINGISMVKERQASKNIPITNVYKDNITVYDRPTPINIKVEVTIMAKYMTDLYQMYGKLATQFQPSITYSWFVPQVSTSNWVELRNKIEWDGELNLDIRGEAKNSDEDKFTGKLGFNIDGWLFPSMNTCTKGIIHNIGTTVVTSEEVMDRIYDTSLERPLVYSVLRGDSWEKYNNPRQFATAHPMITSIYYSQQVNSKEAYYILDKKRAETISLKPGFNVSIHGYNLKDAKVFAIPVSKETIISNIKKTSVKYDKDLHPFPDSKVEKPDKISGYPLNIKKQTDNLITIEFKKPLNIDGKFDIAVVTDIDYDLLSKRKGFILQVKE